MSIRIACHVSAPKDLPGVNLLDAEKRAQRQHIFGAAYSIHNMTVGSPAATRQYRWVITRRWKYLKRDHGKDTTSYKFVHLWDQAPEHLFDLAADPGETKNLAKSESDVTARLLAAGAAAVAD